MMASLPRTFPLGAGKRRALLSGSFKLFISGYKVPSLPLNNDPCEPERTIRGSSVGV